MCITDNVLEVISSILLRSKKKYSKDRINSHARKVHFECVLYYACSYIIIFILYKLERSYKDDISSVMVERKFQMY